MKINYCYSDICNINEDACRCNFIKLLPNGILWDEQKRFYLSNKKVSKKASLVHFAAFLGSVYYIFVNDVIYPFLRESSVNTALTTIDDYLYNLGWNYKGLEQYDFSPDGLFLRHIEKINHIDTIVRNKDDYSKYNYAVKSAIAKILNKSIFQRNILNIKRFNELFYLLSVELIFSHEEPKINYRKIAHNLYLIVKEPAILTLPNTKCNTENQSVILNNLKGKDIDKEFKYDDFLLDIGYKLTNMVLDFNNLKLPK